MIRPAHLRNRLSLFSYFLYSEMNASVSIMLKVSKTICLAVAILLVFGVFFGAFAQGTDTSPFSINVSPLPKPVIGPVNDYVGVMQPADIAALNRELIDFKKKYNVEFAVAVVDTTGGRDISEYSIAVARGWGIGSTDQDNPGALLLVAVSDRKYFTQISRDLEDELTDGLAGSIQRQYLVPEFKKGNYGKGIADTMHAYMARVESVRDGTATPVPETDRSGETSGADLIDAVLCLIIVGFIIFVIFVSRNDRGGRGGFGGGGGGGMLPWIIGSAIANSGSGSSSGWSSGGSDWGGGGGWGGFGGGGDFGGGGAGGGW